jgi:hypothetical protein
LAGTLIKDGGLCDCIDDDGSVHVFEQPQLLMSLLPEWCWVNDSYHAYKWWNHAIYVIDFSPETCYMHVDEEGGMVQQESLCG